MTRHTKETGANIYPYLVKATEAVVTPLNKRFNPLLISDPRECTYFVFVLFIRKWFIRK